MLRSRCLLSIALLALSLPALAGGPLVVGGPTFGVEGQPFVWDNSHPILYRTDTGPLGDMSNSIAIAHVQAAMAVWTGVPTANLATVNSGPIQGVAGGHVASVADFNTVQGSCSAGSQTPIIFDSNGSLFAELIGDASVVGFTSLCRLSADGHIQGALSVFSGAAGLSDTQQDHAMEHEFGHLFGLDHSLPGTDPCGTSPADIAALPIMYFTIDSQTGLTVDDKAWISKLYPSASFNTVYGTITGQVLFSDGQNAVQDVLVSAHPARPGASAGEDRSQAWSSISGFRFTGNPGQSFTADYLPCPPDAGCPHGFYGNNADGSSFGSRIPSLLGWYEIPVPAGEYAVEISDLLQNGTIGPNNPAIPLPGPAEYWNPHESSTDSDFTHFDCTVAQQLSYITVESGKTTGGIDIIMNGTAPSLDIFETGQLASPLPLSLRSALSVPAMRQVSR